MHSPATTVILDTIKKAEDSNNIIVRCYEAVGGRGKATLQVSKQLGKTIKSVSVVNILEQTMQDDKVAVTIKHNNEEQNSNSIDFHIRPFQILTLSIEMAK